MRSMSSTPPILAIINTQQNPNTKRDGMTCNVSSHLPPNRRRITRWIVNVARNLAATGFDLPHAAATESAHRSSTPPSHWAEGQANHVPETGARPQPRPFHSSTLPVLPHHSAGCKANHAIRCENMAAARSGGFHVFFSSFFLRVFDVVMGYFPRRCFSPASSLPSIFEADISGTGNFHLQSPPPVLPSRQRLLAGTSPHYRGTRGSHGWEARPGDWIAFLDGQSRSAGPPLHY
ncbi:hypothetical protein B0T18DRAFT_169594 [Schizothecium vesticola]|uniref:Uncharacterized protein n=1 Tax=Schizothecium vesticola TaxID=314040 RepID=A0AA40K1R0_9PEZI|nr:hypothetical protein B0T18DRAFT_169594 [Schizothecium vesticola]